MPDPGILVAVEIVGRFHPLLVHFPIGLLFLAGLFEFLSYFKKYRKLRGAVQTTLFWGAVFSTLSAVSGYVLSQEGGYDDRLLDLHRNAGIVTASFAWILFFIRRSAVTFFHEKEKQKLVRIFLFVPMLGVLSLTGHLGGSLTHGEEFFFPPDPHDSSSGKLSLSPAVLAHPDSAVLYRDVVEPILRSKCYGCHSSVKQKGQLRLDTPELLRKGGKHGAVINNHIVDSSALYSRMVLSVEDEKHMPPKEKPQPESAEIDLVHAWIEGGASFEKQVREFKSPAKIKEYLAALVDEFTQPSLTPDREVGAAPMKAVEALSSKGVIVLPVAKDSHYLSVNFVNARSLGNDDLSLLLPLKEQLLWLNLARTKITDKGLVTISQLPNLTQLNLEYTGVSDAGMKPLKQLSSLTVLNLVGTEVGDDGISSLAAVKSLNKIFVYKSKVTKEGVLALKQNAPALVTDTGMYILPPRITDTLVFGKRQ